MRITVILYLPHSVVSRIRWFVHAGVAERQRGETVRLKRAAEGMAETAARPGEGQATGGAHPQEGKAQEGDGETRLIYFCN